MKQNKLLDIQIQNVMAQGVGPDHGITSNDMKTLKSDAEKAFSRCLKQYSDGRIGFMKVPEDKQALQNIQSVIETHRNRWENLVVFGIGGSALGITMLANALCHPYHNQLDADLRSGCPRLFVLDNMDPEMVSGLRSIIEPEKTLINIITKSGGTIETWGNYFQYLSVFKQKPAANQVVAITDPEHGFLNKYASIQDWETLPVPQDLGGRFSVLSPVGLFAAGLLNIDIEELMEGARVMHAQCLNPDMDNNPALKLAAVTHFLLSKKGKTISAFMPYTNALSSFADWYRQLWAESLGKQNDLEGNPVFAGQTPVKSVGATDQHSQIQLYREGPNDKLITFLTVDEFRFGGSMIDAPENTPLENIRLLDAGEVLNIEYVGTRDSLTESNRPNLTIALPELSPFYLGQLIYLYEMTTFITGTLMNINPFDQPGVEAGKIIAKRLIQDVFDSRS